MQADDENEYEVGQFIFLVASHLALNQASESIVQARIEKKRGKLIWVCTTFLFITQYELIMYFFAEILCQSAYSQHYLSSRAEVIETVERLWPL
jgi:hypothetical protein